MLEIKNLSVFYGRIQALKDINLRIDRGEIVALVGANGAGKSSLINTVSGLLIPKEGEIAFFDQRIDGMLSEKIVRLGLIQVAEGRELFPELTVWENLKMGAYTLKDSEQIERNAKMVFDLFPVLGEKKQAVAQTMSGGEQQMLAIARALMASPRMIMLDEPSLGLAPLLVERIFKVVLKLNQELDLPILLVEQNVKFSLKISNRGYVLERGQIVLEDTGEALLKNPDVEKAYMGV